MKSIFQKTITDDEGNVVPSASVEFRFESNNALAQTWTDRDGLSAAGNPITADSNGFAQAYLTPGRYKVTATGVSGSITWRNVLVFPEDLTGFLGSDPVIGHYIEELEADQTVITTGFAVNDDYVGSPDQFKRHMVFLNGVLLINSVFSPGSPSIGEYSVTDEETGEFTLVESAEEGDVFEYIDLSVYGTQSFVTESATGAPILEATDDDFELTELTQSIGQTVGKTGSGADAEWAALDQYPDNCLVAINAAFEVEGVSGSTDSLVELYLGSIGSPVVTLQTPIEDGETRTANGFTLVPMSSGVIDVQWQATDQALTPLTVATAQLSTPCCFRTE